MEPTPFRNFPRRVRNFTGSNRGRLRFIVKSVMPYKARYVQFCILTIVATLAAGVGYQRDHEKKEPERPGPGENVLWMDPGDVASLDFKHGIGGSERQPQPPFLFVDEDMSGTIAKVNLTDSRGAFWNVKWGREAKASAFCTRLVWACGYFVEQEYFVARGRIEGAHGLKRAKSHVSNDGTFVKARFQLRSASPKYLDGESWTWAKNPFRESRELQGLKILMLLVSNWDAKDARDFVSVPTGGSHMDSNLGIFLDDSSGERRYFYADDDWGASLGKWGSTFTWTKWDCEGFAAQTPDFVKGVDNGWLRWGFNGKHRKDLTAHISVYDVEWLLTYLGRITDEQIRIGLEASGATPKETNCYQQALRQRIQQLQEAVGGYESGGEAYQTPGTRR